MIETESIVSNMLQANKQNNYFPIIGFLAWQDCFQSNTGSLIKGVQYDL